MPTTVPMIVIFVECLRPDPLELPSLASRPGVLLERVVDVVTGRSPLVVRIFEIVWLPLTVIMVV